MAPPPIALPKLLIHSCALPGSLRGRHWASLGGEGFQRVVSGHSEFLPVLGAGEHVVPTYLIAAGLTFSSPLIPFLVARRPVWADVSLFPPLPAPAAPGSPSPPSLFLYLSGHYPFPPQIAKSLTSSG